MKGQTAARGSTLLELVVAMTLLGTMIMLLVILTSEMMKYERKLPVNYMVHPQVSSVIARLRRDVSSACCSYYPSSEGAWSQSPTTLIVESLQQSGTSQVVVWDFSISGEVHRHAFTGHMEMSEWSARGLPKFKIDDFPLPNSPDSVRIRAYDAGGKLAIDQIFQPRPH
ncbi:MAG: type II secretion system protein [Acidobacteriota bacterium]